jgi:hypothetical protein
MAARTIREAAVNSGNSISTIDRATTKSPNTMFTILEDLYLDALVEVVVIAVVASAVVAVIAVVLTTPKQILSIPVISKTIDKRRTVVDIEEPGIMRIMAANKTEIEPNTIWSDLNHGGVLIICIIFDLLVPQHQEVLYKYLAIKQPFSFPNMHPHIWQTTW